MPAENAIDDFYDASFLDILGVLMIIYFAIRIATRCHSAPVISASTGHQPNYRFSLTSY